MEQRKPLRSIASVGHGACLPGGRPLGKTAARVAMLKVDVGTSVADVHDGTLVILDRGRLQRLVMHDGEARGNERAGFQVAGR